MQSNVPSQLYIDQFSEYCFAYAFHGREDVYPFLSLAFYTHVYAQKFLNLSELCTSDLVFTARTRTDEKRLSGKEPLNSSMRIS